MATENSTSAPDRIAPPAGAGEVEAARSELVRILNSPAFRGTRRSQDFLRYVVEHALSGDAEALKERSIGVTVFSRPADYDTGQDSIVRVNANEVRKRLAQYYGHSGTGTEVRIELPAGSYAPEFLWPAKPASGEPAPTPSRARLGLILGVAAGVLVGVLTITTLFRGTRPSPLDAFWRPVIASPQPVLLCVAHPVVYQVSGQTRAKLNEGAPPPQTLPWTDLTRDPDHYVGVGDAFALAQLSGYFGRAGKPAQIRIGTDTSFADLRHSPAVLIGAYTNQWTIEVTRDCRFVFERDSSNVFVRDTANPGRRWVHTTTTPASDFAILSRLVDSKTGSIVVVGAGLAHFGTRVAGEALTNPAAIAEAVKDAPPGWESKNLQIVLRAEVVGQTPGPPKVLAAHFW